MNFQLLDPTYTLKRWQRACLLLFSFVFMLVVCWGDYVTGTEIEFRIFYLIPIGMLAWFIGVAWAVWACLTSGLLWYVTNVVLIHHDVHPIIGLWNILVVIVFFLGVALFLSRLKQNYLLERQNNEKITRAYQEIQQLAAVKSEFVAMVSHELRTPLAAIKESIQVVNEKKAGPVTEEQAVFLEMAVRNLNRLSRLISNVLDFSKMEAGKRRLTIVHTSLNRLAQEVARMHHAVAERKGLTFEFDLDPRMPETHFDSDAIAEVMINLIDNAIKYTRSGKIVVGSRYKAPHAEVFVKDTGCGIDAEGMKKLFRPFERLTSDLSPHAEGVGLGLVISKQIVELHHGRMWAESKLSKGTAFYFSIPVRKRQGAVVHEENIIGGR